MVVQIAYVSVVSQNVFQRFVTLLAVHQEKNLLRSPTNVVEAVSQTKTAAKVQMEQNTV